MTRPFRQSDVARAIMLACLALAGCGDVYRFAPWESSDLVCVDQKTEIKVGRERSSGKYTYWGDGVGYLTLEGARAICPGMVK
jgi:hypothetical protein